jgi:plasmid stabilization system protein ParE
MSDSYKIEWADVAENDLKGIVGYIAEDSPSNALKTLKK